MSGQGEIYTFSCKYTCVCVHMCVCVFLTDIYEEKNVRDVKEKVKKSVVTRGALEDLSNPSIPVPRPKVCPHMECCLYMYCTITACSLSSIVIRYICILWAATSLV